MGKRVIAILRRPIAAAPPRRAALNVKIDATADDAAGFATGVNALAAALDRDVAWLHEPTRLLLAANDWMQSGERDERRPDTNQLLTLTIDYAARASGGIEIVGLAVEPAQESDFEALSRPPNIDQRCADRATTPPPR